MNVTETWDINISSTNTLYKTFKTDSKKYSNITDVTVTDITNESSVNFVKTNDWAYHVTKGYYYGTENNDGNFEIGWGVGLDNSSANKKYKISYTVNDVITKYNDYSELYWQFVGEDFEISSKKITGTIYLPSNASNKDDIKVWGHTKDLNGTIYATDTNKIEFNLDNFRSGRYVEIRTLFPTNLISSTGRTKNTDILDSAVNEETKWANKANNERRRLKIAGKIILILVILACVIINIFVSVIYIKNIKKNKKKLKELKKYKPTIELEYFRDLPSEESTPGEAIRTVNII